jgi:hypothetical protein
VISVSGKRFTVIKPTREHRPTEQEETFADESLNRNSIMAEKEKENLVSKECSHNHN